MSYVGERVAFLRGLAEGMEIDESTPERKLIMRMMEVLEDIAAELEELEENQYELDDAIDDLQEDVGIMEHVLLGEDHPHHHDHDHGPESPFSDDFLEVECPGCGNVVYFDKEAVASEDIECPECGQALFPKNDLPES